MLKKTPIIGILFLFITCNQDTKSISYKKSLELNNQAIDLFAFNNTDSTKKAIILLDSALVNYPKNKYFINNKIRALELNKDFKGIYDQLNISKEELGFEYDFYIYEAFLLSKLQKDNEMRKVIVQGKHYFDKKIKSSDSTLYYMSQKCILDCLIYPKQKVLLDFDKYFEKRKNSIDLDEFRQYRNYIEKFNKDDILQN